MIDEVDELVSFLVPGTRGWAHPDLTPSSRQNIRSLMELELDLKLKYVSQNLVFGSKNRSEYEMLFLSLRGSILIYSLNLRSQRRICLVVLVKSIMES